MACNVQKMPLWYTNKIKNLPTVEGGHPHPLLARSLAPSLCSLALAPRWQILAYTSVTGVAKGGGGAQGPMPHPVYRSKNGKGGVRDWLYANSHNLPLIMTFNVQKKGEFWYTIFKKSPYRGRGTPPPLCRFTPSLWHPKSWLHHYHWHSGGTNAQVPMPPPPSPVDRSKWIWKGVGIDICHFT